MITCPKCHKLVTDDVQTCPRCGIQLQEVDEEAISAKLIDDVADSGLLSSGGYTSPSTNSVPRERGGCLSLWLIVVIGSNILGLMRLLCSDENFTLIPFLLGLSFGLGAIFFAVALWNWKKWGAYGLATIMTVNFFIGFVLEDFFLIMSSIVPALILVVLVSPKWHQMDSTQRETFWLR